MEYRYLGRSGLLVSELAMGTQTFGWGVDESTAHRMADTYTAAGGILFDTSSTYNEGESERILGSWLHASKRRDSVVVATKVFFATGAGPNDTGLSRKHIMGTAEASLERLRTDYIDLYQAHCYDLATPIDETLDALNDLVRMGKVRYVGCSNFAAWQVVEAQLTAQRINAVPFISYQDEYSLVERSIERELIPVATRYGMGLLPYFPLASGLLTGKYRQGTALPQGARLTSSKSLAERYLTEANWRIVEGLREVATKSGHSLVELAFSWLAAQPAVASVIAGATKPEQVKENATAVGWRLSESERAEVARVLGGE